MVYDVPADAVEFVRNDDIDVVSVPRWYQHHLTLQRSRQDVSKSPLVRKALNLAMDRAAIVKKVLHGAGEPSAGPVYPEVLGVRFDASQVSVRPCGGRRAAGLRRLPARQRPREPRPRRPVFGLPVCSPKISQSGSASRSKFKGTCLISASTCSSRSCRSRSSTHWSFSGQFEAAFINMISGPTPSRSYMWWRSAQQFKGPSTSSDTRTPRRSAFEILLRSTNEAAIRSATVEASAGLL